MASEKYVALDNRAWPFKSSLLIDINNRKGNKEFLLGKFNEGARSGYKADPVQLAKEIKEVRHEGGHVKCPGGGYTAIYGLYRYVPL